MTWGAFSAAGTLEIQFTSSKMNSSDYITVLKSSLLPFLRGAAEKEWVFQQDNASIHTSRETLAWLRANNIQFMEWPSRSPDLNPIENVWGILVRKVYANYRTYDSVSSLKTAIVEEWENLEQKIIENLVNSMPKRIFDVILAKGGPINY